MYKSPEYTHQYLEHFSRDLHPDITQFQAECFLEMLQICDNASYEEIQGIRVYTKGVHAWHHVLPKSLYPQFEFKIPPATSNFNEVPLTKYEHLRVHYLLFEFYERAGEMAGAFDRMCHGQTPELVTEDYLTALKNWNYTHSTSTKGKISASMQGNQNSLGRVQSEETRKKMSIAKKGQKYNLVNPRPSVTDTARANMSIAQKGKKKVIIKKTCPHCQKEGRDCMMTRYHFDNCKMKPV